MQLYDRRNHRLYVNENERLRFLAATHNAEPVVRNFALTLLYSGCRLSEALPLTFADLNEHGRVLSIRSLKKRHRHEVREVPIPPELAGRLSQLRGQFAPEHGPDLPQINLWSNRLLGRSVTRSKNLAQLVKPPDRITGYRWIKTVMAEAGIYGKQASPKGLRHGYGVHAICSGVQLNMLCKWMGHASMKTTAIYANAVGCEELAIADRMWSEQVPEVAVGG